MKQEVVVGTIKHPADSRTQLKVMKQIIDDTMMLMLQRRTLRPDYGWIDLKLDAISGEDMFESDGIRGKNHIYSWIQGRGLEAIATHLKWYDRVGWPSDDAKEELISLGRSVSANLQRQRRSNGGHLYFLATDRSHPTEDTDVFTMSDLFCSRGLYAFNHDWGTEEERRASRRYITDTLQAIIGNKLVNDQIGFHPSQYQGRKAKATGFGTEMLGLGAVTLLMRLERDSNAPAIGRRFVEKILSKHVNSMGRWPSIEDGIIVEMLDDEGNVFLDEEGRVLVDPGHSLEFIGLAAQMVAVYLECYGNEETEYEWMIDVGGTLDSLIEPNLKLGFSETGGIVKRIDAVSKTIPYDTMPWWSLPETLRAIALTEHLKKGPWSTFGTEWFERCLSAFTENYRKPSACPIAVQTIDSSGKPVDVIPATPDLDPGYHTGLALLDCCNVLSKQSVVLQ